VVPRGGGAVVAGRERWWDAVERAGRTASWWRSAAPRLPVGGALRRSEPPRPVALGRGALVAVAPGGLVAAVGLAAARRAAPWRTRSDATPRNVSRATSSTCDAAAAERGRAAAAGDARVPTLHPAGRRDRGADGVVAAHATASRARPSALVGGRGRASPRLPFAVRVSGSDGSPRRRCCRGRCHARHGGIVTAGVVTAGPRPRSEPPRSEPPRSSRTLGPARAGRTKRPPSSRRFPVVRLGERPSGCPAVSAIHHLLLRPRPCWTCRSTTRGGAPRVGRARRHAGTLGAERQLVAAGRERRRGTKEEGRGWWGSERSIRPPEGGDRPYVVEPRPRGPFDANR